jgi:hypothetical protein
MSINQTKKQIEKKMELIRKMSLARGKTHAHNVFVYLSSHGASLEHGELHAVMPSSDGTQDYEFVNIDRFLHNLSIRPNIHVTALFDCCRERLSKGLGGVKQEVQH